MELEVTFVVALVTGIMYGGIGYLKREDLKEKFSWTKFIASVIIGLVAGVYAWGTKQQMEPVLLGLTTGGAIYFVENTIKALIRRIKG